MMLCSLLQNRQFKLSIFFNGSTRQQGWALAHSPAHHINKLSPAVQHVWFGWYWGLGIFPYGGGRGCVFSEHLPVLGLHARPFSIHGPWSMLKNCMGRGQHPTHGRTSRLLDRIGSVDRFGENCKTNKTWPERSKNAQKRIKNIFKFMM